MSKIATYFPISNWRDAILKDFVQMSASIQIAYESEGTANERK